jgi:hypothetical protein
MLWVIENLGNNREEGEIGSEGSERSWDTSSQPVLFRVDKATEQTMTREAVIHQITKQSTQDEPAEDVINRPRSTGFSFNGVEFYYLKSAAAHRGGALTGPLSDSPVRGTRLITACANEPEPLDQHVPNQRTEQLEQHAVH